jgi:hypothetical protein
VHDVGQMVNILNGFFISVFTREDTANVPEPNNVAGGNRITDVKITVKQVKDKIKGLREDAATGDWTPAAQKTML